MSRKETKTKLIAVLAPALAVSARHAAEGDLNQWDGRMVRTQIVAIGAPDAFDQEALRDKFEKCLSALNGILASPD